jgi:galactose mutarotase-like enzyme
MSGWDEMFPTIVACTYPGNGPRHGESLPDHGEAWALPWAVTEAGNGRLTLRLEGRALPYRLERTADCPEPRTIRFHYRLTNLGDEPMPYVWAAHPQFLCGESAEVVFPPQVRQVINTIPASWGWGDPETRFSWPSGTAVDGSPARLDRTSGPQLQRGRKFFVLPDVATGWAALHRSDRRWLRFNWDSRAVPYLGLWVDEGALNHATVAAPEPTTGWYDSLEVAWNKGCVETVAAHGEREWELIVTLGEGDPGRL